MSDTVLVLRTCDEDLTAYNDFQWPESGPVEALDWDPEPECGHGLHGYLWGQGDGIHLDWDISAKWLVVEVKWSEIVSLEDKVKFPRGNVVHCGDQLSATNYLLAHGAQGPVIGSTMVVGHNGSVETGVLGTSIAGDHGVATSQKDGRAITGDHGKSTTFPYGISISGHRGEATSGDHGYSMVASKGFAQTGTGGISIAGYEGKAVSGYAGCSLTQDNGTAISEHYGTSIAGARGTAKAGERGLAVAGEYGQVVVGLDGRALVGPGGIAQGGPGAVLMFTYRVQQDRLRVRVKIAYVGEDGIEPNTPYYLDTKTQQIVKSTKKQINWEPMPSEEAVLKPYIKP